MLDTDLFSLGVLKNLDLKADIGTKHSLKLSGLHSAKQVPNNLSHGGGAGAAAFQEGQ